MNHDHDAIDTILPRSAWDNQKAYLRALLKAKMALDDIESKQGVKQNERHEQTISPIQTSISPND